MVKSFKKLATIYQTFAAQSEQLSIFLLIIYKHRGFAITRVDKIEMKSCETEELRLICNSEKN